MKGIRDETERCPAIVIAGAAATAASVAASIITTGLVWMALKGTRFVRGSDFPLGRQCGDVEHAIVVRARAPFCLKVGLVPPVSNDFVGLVLDEQHL